MGDGYRGVSYERDSRFLAAERKLMAKMKFPPEFAQKVEMPRVHLEVLRPWVAKKVCSLQRPAVYVPARCPYLSIRIPVNLRVTKATKRTQVTGYLGMEDDIVINMVMAELEKENEPDPRRYMSCAPACALQSVILGCLDVRAPLVRWSISRSLPHAAGLHPALLAGYKST